MDILSELNNEQRRAVETTDGPFIIVAGPGTGKTKTLTARITYLLEVKNIKPQELLALTFTNKAAAEMRQRVKAQLKTKQLPKITTFHALCYELLSAGRVSRVEFISEHERLLMIKELRKGATLKALTTRELSLAISRLKNQLPQATVWALLQEGTLRSQAARFVPPGNVEPSWSRAQTVASPPQQDEGLTNLLATYNQALRQRNLYDFDDLLQQAYKLLSTKQTKQQFSHLLVDEFQDTNALQYELLQLLRNNDNLCVIGDPRQSIYGFRGASGDVFGRFKADFPHCRSTTLTTNYRSALSVVGLANAIFPGTIPLQPYSQRAGRVRLIEVLNEYSESSWVINQIEQSLGGSDFLRSHHQDYGGASQSRTFRDFAILYRTHHVSKPLRRALAESGLPFQIIGENSPYEQPAIWTIIQLLCYLIEPTQARLTILQRLVNLQNVPKQQLTAILEQLHLASNKVLTEQALFIAQKLDVKSPLLTQFINSLVRFEAKSAAFVAYVDSLSEHNFYDARADTVTLMSIHAAKGLEFTHVFLLAVEEGILPLAKLNKPADLAEEKRLFYVAASRARDNLDILHAKMRTGVIAQPSSFLNDLPEDILERTQDESMAGQLRRQEKRQVKRRQATLFDI